MLNDAKIRAAKARKNVQADRRTPALSYGDAERFQTLEVELPVQWSAEDHGDRQLSYVLLLDARACREEARRVLAEGKDPVVEKRLNIEANLRNGRCTFERVAREWHAELNGQWARKHALDVMRSLERDVFPMIGNLPIAQLTSPAVLEVLRAIEARGAIETAKRVRQRISMVFIYAIANGQAMRIRPRSLALCSSRSENVASPRSRISNN
jgi:hypothetical protein